jgi:hypothetical protein
MIRGTMTVDGTNERTRRRRGQWLFITIAIGCAPTLIASDSSASPRKDAIQAHLDQLHDADYQARCLSLQSAKRNLPAWIKSADPDDGNGSGAIDPCSDVEHVRTVFVGTFTRTAGPPNVFGDRFKVRARGELCLKIENDGISSSRVWVDGDELLTPSDFSATVTQIQVADEVDRGEHELEVRVTASPGASFTLEIRAALAEDLAQIVALFLQALSDAGPNDAVVREAIAAGAVEGGALEDVQQVLGEIAAGRSGNFSSLTRAQSVRVFGIQSAELYDAGEPELDAALNELAGILATDRTGSVRSAAAQAIGGLGDPNGITILDAAVAVEMNPIVIAAIQNARANLQASLPEVP